MTRKEEIKELESALRTVMNPLRDYDLELEAEIMIDDGWHKQIEARWKREEIYDDDGYGAYEYEVKYTCSNCLEKQRVNTRYCPVCGAKMRGAI